MSMEEKKFAPPSVKGYDQAYELSYRLASEKLKDTTDIKAQCLRAGVVLRAAGTRTEISITYLGREHIISLPEVDITLTGSKGEIALRDKLLILHYFNTARGTPLTNKPVTFRELPAGPVYFPTYTKRAIDPFVRAFAAHPDQLIAAAAKLSGRPADQADASAIIDAFPRVAIIYTLWKGDDELPPQGNILYDSNIPDYLPTEDITVLTESITWRLVRG